MRPKLAIYSKYFGHAVGGAERSVFELVREKEREGWEIHVFRTEGLKTFGADRLRMELPATWTIHPARLPVDWIRFKYAAAMINRRSVAAQLAAVSGAHLWSYGFQAPMALLDHEGEGTYLVRDEYGLGWEVNYFEGWRRGMKWAYTAVEGPWRKAWLANLETCLAVRKTMVNSRFLERELRKLRPEAAIEVRLPHVDVGELRRRYEGTPEEAELGIVMVGDNRIKGSDIFRRIAARFPDQRFYLVDRDATDLRKHGNLHILPWIADSASLYRKARIVIVPSRWAESFPRMILEAQALGIPVLGSERGGIPDAIADPARIVRNLEDVDEWASKLASLL